MIPDQKGARRIDGERHMKGIRHLKPDMRFRWKLRGRIDGDAYGKGHRDLPHSGKYSMWGSERKRAVVIDSECKHSFAGISQMGGRSAHFLRQNSVTHGR